MRRALLLLIAFGVGLALAASAVRAKSRETSPHEIVIAISTAAD